MKNFRLAAPLALLLLLAAAAAHAEGLLDDMSKIRSNFGYKIYEGMLKGQAAAGDKWSGYRLREIDKAVDVAESGKKFSDTSWWSPVDKVSAGYAAWKDKNEYFQASTERREYEKRLAEAGITPSGKRSEDAMTGTLKFLGNFSGAAREGSVLIDKMKQVEDSSYRYHTTSWLNPIKKIDAAKDFLSDSKDARTQYENFKYVSKHDPFVQFGQTVSKLGSTITGLFGGNRNTCTGPGCEDVYAGGSAKGPGRIRDASAGGSGDFTAEIDRATEDMKRSFAEIKTSIRDLKSSFRGMGRELSRGVSDLSARAGGSCVGPNCPPAAAPVRVNDLLDKLQNKGIK